MNNPTYLRRTAAIERRRAEKAREDWWRMHRPAAGEDAPMTFEGAVGKSKWGRANPVSGMVAGTDPAIADVYYDPDELEFIRAVERYQREHRRKFPTFVEVLDVAKALGYRKVAEPGPLPVYRRADGDRGDR